MSINFFKNIQPGIIESNGTFKKIVNPANIKDASTDFFAKK